MPLPDISKEINFKLSVRKFFYEIANSFSPSLPLLFDTGLQVPVDSESEAPKWLTVEFGTFIAGSVNEALVDVYCCARKDVGSDVVTELRDIVVGNFTDSTQSDSTRRIPIYVNLNTSEEEIIGWMIADIAYQSPYMKATDGTKYKLVTINLKWGGQY
jgi:hypothetical protein